MRIRGIHRGALTGLLILVMIGGWAPSSLAGPGDVEQRIADFWRRVDAMQPADYLSSADLGQWAQNLIERDSSSRLTVFDFRASTAGMQAAMDRAGPGQAIPTPVRVTPLPPVEVRIADFWKRVDALRPGDYLSSSDLGQWGLNVSDRNGTARLTVQDFRPSTASMQSAIERAGRAPTAAPTVPPTPIVPRPVSTPIATPITTPTILPPAPTATYANPWGYDFAPGSLIYSPPSTFCVYFSCIANFTNGNGYVIQCKDGMFSRSGGIQGSCSFHNGNYRTLYSHSTLTIATPIPIAPIAPIITTHYIRKNMGSGRYLLLEDNSVWQISSFDRYNTMMWFTLEDIVVSTSASCLNYRLVNTSSSSASCARYLGRAGNHWISSITGQGQYVKLEDYSVWQIDLFDRSDTWFWSAFDNITVAMDLECTYNYRLINTDQGEIACAQ